MFEPLLMTTETITEKMIQTVAVSAAHRMGCRDLSDEKAEDVLIEARDYQRHMKADALAAWLGCTWADRCALVRAMRPQSDDGRSTLRPARQGSALLAMRISADPYGPGHDGS
jgi:hypothetical protein